jgi:quinol monooxygenase YgiN
MPAVYALGVYAQPGKEDALTEAFQALGESLKKQDGFMGRHVLRGTGGLKPTPEQLASGQHANERPEDHGPEAIHFLSIEIWRDAAARQAHRDTPEFKEWYSGFKVNLMPQHTHGWYEDIAGH